LPEVQEYDIVAVRPTSSEIFVVSDILIPQKNVIISFCPAMNIAGQIEWITSTNPSFRLSLHNTVFSSGSLSLSLWAHFIETTGIQDNVIKPSFTQILWTYNVHVTFLKCAEIFQKIYLLMILQHSASR
jgi:hypothetical protein